MYTVTRKALSHKGPQGAMVRIRESKDPNVSTTTTTTTTLMFICLLGGIDSNINKLKLQK